MKRNVFLVLAAACALVLAGPGLGRDAAQDAADLAQKAEALALEKKYDESIALMRKAIDLEPRNDRYLGLASQIEQRAGRYAEGLEHALAAIKVNDKMWFYYALVVANAYGNQDLDLAREYCKKILDRGAAEVGPEVYRDTKAYEA